MVRTGNLSVMQFVDDTLCYDAMMRDSKDHRVKMLHNNNKKKVAQ